MRCYQFSFRRNLLFPLSLFVALRDLWRSLPSRPILVGVVVQPGAPGQPTKNLPPSTRAKLPPRSPKDVEFMQGMIMHHAQAVEMTALIESRTENKELRLLGARISKSQSDEIEVYETVARSPGRADIASDGRNERSCDGPSQANAGNADPKADGSFEKSKRRGVRSIVFGGNDPASQRRA